MDETGRTNEVLARYHPAGVVLAPALLLLAFGLFMAWPYLHPGGVDGFVDEYRRGASYWFASIVLGPLGIGMGLLLAYRMISQRGVAVRYDGDTFHFTQPLMVSVPGKDILSAAPSKTGIRNVVLKLREGRSKTIYGSFYDRSSLQIARDIHARLGLPGPDHAEDPDPLDVIRTRRAQERAERATRNP